MAETDRPALAVVHELEHKVRHLLGLYDGLARFMLSEIPYSEVELRRVVAGHAERAPELSGAITGIFARLTILCGEPAAPSTVPDPVAE